MKNSPSSPKLAMAATAQAHLSNAGDGNSASDYVFKQGSVDTDPWYITSENAITINNVTNDGYYYQSTGAAGESATGAAFLLTAH